MQHQQEQVTQLNQQSGMQMEVDPQVPVKQESTGSGAINVWYRLVDNSGKFLGTAVTVQLSESDLLINLLNALKQKRAEVQNLEIAHIKVYAPNRRLTSDEVSDLLSTPALDDNQLTLDEILKYDGTDVKKKQYPLIVQLPIVVQEGSYMSIDGIGGGPGGRAISTMSLDSGLNEMRNTNHRFRARIVGDKLNRVPANSTFARFHKKMMPSCLIPLDACVDLDSFQSWLEQFSKRCSTELKNYSVFEILPDGTLRNPNWPVSGTKLYVLPDGENQEAYISPESSYIELVQSNAILQFSNPIFNNLSIQEPPLEGLSDSYYSVPRSSVIKRLKDMLNSANVALIRGPASCGKTSLRQLLEYNLRHWSNTAVYSFTFASENGCKTFSEFWEKETGLPWSKFVASRNQDKTRVTYLLIDEAQVLYNDSMLTGTIEFWNTLKSVISDKSHRIRVVLFGTRGYRTLNDVTLRTPIDISESQCLGFRDLRFSFEEIKDYLTFAFYSLPDNSHKVRLFELMKELSNGHIGCLAAMVRTIVSKGKYKEVEWNSEAIYKLVQSKRFATSMASYRFSTFAAVSENMSPDAIRVCYTVATGNVIRQGDNDVLTQLIHVGILYEDDGVYYFTNSFILSKFMDLLRVKRERPKVKLEGLSTVDFLRLSLSQMSSTVLQNTLSCGKDGRLLERAIQMEFYTATHLCLPDCETVSPDVGTGCYLDFYIGERSWGFELLRDGDRMAQHFFRFSEAGSYRDLVPDDDHWLVVDFRTKGSCPEPRSAVQRDNLVRVSFESDFKKAQVEWLNGRDVVDLA